MAGKLTKILVDVHEPPEIAASLRARGLDIEVVHLKYGDFAFSNVLIERKEWNDLLNSLADGRLWKQIYNIKHSSERPILLVEMSRFGHPDLMNLWKQKDIRGVEFQTRVMGAIATIFLHGVSVIILPSREQLLLFIERTFFSSDKSTPSFKPIPKKSEMENLMETKEDMICMIRGISRVKAKEIMARYPNYHDLCHATKDDLRKIPGIGPKLAETIWKVLNDGSDKLLSPEPVKEVKEVKNEEKKEILTPQPDEFGVFQG